MRLAALFSIVALGLVALVDPAFAVNPVPQPVPEPGTLGLLAAGAAGVAYMVRKYRK
jgi:hypothetical protein